jgi:hypothetical protein
MIRMFQTGRASGQKRNPNVAISLPAEIAASRIHAMQFKNP